jgi:HSP20 family protein
MTDLQNNPQAMEKQETQTPEGVELTRQERMFLPAVDIHETDQAVVVEADMPGVAADGIDVTVENDTLTIHGRVAGEAPEGYQPAYSEYDTGDYHRTFALSNKIDAEAIEATMRNGVLTLTLPKVRPAHKKIEVQ